MNQTKWLSDFKYDVESTPLLWSFDESDQDAETSSTPLRSQSSPILTELNAYKLRDYSIYQAHKNYVESCFMENKKGRSQSFPERVFGMERKNAKSNTNDKQFNLKVREYLELSSKTPEPSETRANKNDFKAEELINSQNRSRKFSPTLDIASAPTYVEVQHRESEMRRLLSLVKPFPSYLAISSPEIEEEDITQNKTVAGILYPETDKGIFDDGEIVTIDIDASYLERSSSKSSLNEAPDNVEYLSGGIWYSDEEEEKAIQKEAGIICAYENPAFIPDASDEEFTDTCETIHEKLEPDVYRRTNEHRKKFTKALSREIDSDSAISLDDHSVDDFPRDLDSTQYSLRSASRLDDIGEACEYDPPHDAVSVSCFSTHSRLSSCKLADVVSFDDVASLIEQCNPGNCSADEDKTSSSSEFEIISQTSTCTQILSPDTPPPGSPMSDMSIDSELVWDAYIPPLTLRWSDVMIKQIFDIVEHDNEEYVQHLRQLACRDDIRPLNILQRLCWFDEDSGSVQSLVGVFEYNI